MNKAVVDAAVIISFDLDILEGEQLLLNNQFLCSLCYLFIYFVVVVVAAAVVFCSRFFLACIRSSK